jgi:hypothetical protein
MQIIGYDWRCTREEWNAEGIVSTAHIVSTMILHHLWEASSFQCLLNCVCGRFTLFFFLFLVFLMIIFCRMPLIILNLGMSIKLTKLSWPFFPPVFFLSQILEHLVDLKSPWNCPHGRPTMRHLIDMSSIYERPDETEAGLWWTFQWHLLAPNALLNLVYMDSASRPESYDAFIKRWNSGFLRVVNQFVSQVFITKKKKHEAVL